MPYHIVWRYSIPFEADQLGEVLLDPNVQSVEIPPGDSVILVTMAEGREWPPEALREAQPEATYVEYRQGVSRTILDGTDIYNLVVEQIRRGDHTPFTTRPLVGFQLINQGDSFLVDGQESIPYWTTLGNVGVTIPNGFLEAGSAVVFLGPAMTGEMEVYQIRQAQSTRQLYVYREHLTREVALHDPVNQSVPYWATLEAATDHRLPLGTLLDGTTVQVSQVFSDHVAVHDVHHGLVFVSRRATIPNVTYEEGILLNPLGGPIPFWYNLAETETDMAHGTLAPNTTVSIIQRLGRYVRVSYQPEDVIDDSQAVSDNQEGHVYVSANTVEAVSGIPQVIGAPQDVPKESKSRYDRLLDDDSVYRTPATSNPDPKGQDHG